MGTRDRLIAILAVATGATDAAAFLRLGHIFASVITGNLVLLMVSAVDAAGRSTVLAGCALGAYALGVVLGAPHGAELRRRDAGDDASEDTSEWPPQTSWVLAAELGLLVAFAVVWEIHGQRPTGTRQLVLLILAAAAMGCQSAAIRRFGSISTTYLTSTLTGVVEALVAHRFTAAERRSVTILILAAAGAAAGAALLRVAPAALPGMQLLPVAGVLFVAGPLLARERDRRDRALTKS